MAPSPRNIMERMGGSREGRPATMRELRKAFLDAGYGSGKAAKWINLYIEEGILTEVQRNENGDMLFDCEWWFKPQDLTA